MSGSASISAGSTRGGTRNLGEAYDQLLKYREALENPPLLVVCDLDRFQVHTNFTNTAKTVHEFSLADLGDAPTEPLRILRAVMTGPEELRPATTPEQVTEQAAERVARLAGALQGRGYEAEGVAHFLNRVLFCLFAEDVGLLPTAVMRRLIDSTLRQPDQFASGLRTLFGLMSASGGLFGTERIDWFNGGLFDGDEVLDLTQGEMEILAEASSLDWSQVEPAILGTLFERGLDPDKRGQLGAHYTDREKILMVVEPVVMTPLHREFEAMQTEVEALLKDRTPAPLTRDNRPRARRPKWERDAEALFFGFLDRLREVRVLDPACGSGNFLYVTLKLLKDLETETAQWGFERLLVTYPQPRIDPGAVLGIEINPYAAELARVSIWIGEIQWMLDNGFGYNRDPILRPLDNIEQRDAILAFDEDSEPRPAEWPDAEFVIGNPPFLGDRMMRGGLGDAYVEALRDTYRDRLPPSADLVCFWHERAREQIADGRSSCAGLLATNSIRGGSNRVVLERMKESGDIFMAWSDEPWIVEGAAVRVSVVGQDAGIREDRLLNGTEVAMIHADLTGGEPDAPDLTQAQTLQENSRVAFVGVQKSGPFDISGDTARELLLTPNPNGRSTSEVVRPWMNGIDLVQRPSDAFIVDFGPKMSSAEASQYEGAFELVRRDVLPVRAKVRRKSHRERWWLHGDARPGLRTELEPSSRYLATPMTSKHRLFRWLPTVMLLANSSVAIARDDDYAFGVLHSRVHEPWSLRMGTWLGKGNDPRYTPTTTFETFPFPWPLNMPDGDLSAEQAGYRDAIGAAARALDEARERWLNPPELVRREPDVVPELPERVLPVDEEAEKVLRKRTLTNLYNDRPVWIENLHADLDRAVLAAYGWPEDIEEDDLLARLLELNVARAGGS